MANHDRSDRRYLLRIVHALLANLLLSAFDCCDAARDEIPALVRLSTQLYRLCKNVSHVWQTTCIPMEPNEVALLMSRVHSQLLFADAPGSAVVLCWQQ